MQRFLVLQLARFGDLVQSKRLMRTLMARGEVHLCIDGGLQGIAALLYPEAIVHPLSVHQRPQADAVETLYATAGALRSIPFDAVYNCNYSPLNLSLTRLFPQDSVYGYRMCGSQEWRDRWIRLVFRLTRQRVLTPVNLVDFWANLAPHPCSPEDACALPEASRPARGADIGVVLAGRESRRSLPPEVLASCVFTAAKAAHAPKVYLLGTNAETPVAHKLLRHLPRQLLDRTVDMTGKTSWQELYALLQSLAMILSPDTGTMHLAAHVGTPVKAFFLSSAWCHETGPYGAGHSVWQATAACAPCLESSPCTLGTVCGQPFTHKHFLRSLAVDIAAAAPTALPEDMALYHTRLDVMGTEFAPVQGTDAHAVQRRLLRERIAEYLQVPLEACSAQGALMAAADISPAQVDALTALVYDDAQWMLEDVYAR